MEKIGIEQLNSLSFLKLGLFCTILEMVKRRLLGYIFGVAAVACGSPVDLLRSGGVGGHRRGDHLQPGQPRA